MKTTDALSLIQTVLPAGEKAKVKHLADVFGITVQAVYDWPDGNLPKLRVFELRDWLDAKKRAAESSAAQHPTEAAA